MKGSFTIKVNGKKHQIDADPETPLLWILRDYLGLKGTKFGCGIAQCGSCTVLHNERAIRSCAIPISAIENSSIVTIEGLAENGYHPVQQAWIDADVPQCGYCQTGQIMSAVALLKKTPNPSDDNIDRAMSGNICRCGTYSRIRKAIHLASQKS